MFFLMSLSGVGPVGVDGDPSAEPPVGDPSRLPHTFPTIGSLDPDQKRQRKWSNQLRMRSIGPRSLRAIPSATGGIARLACARLREQDKDVAAVLYKAGLTVEQANDPTVRLEVRAQIKVLELAAEELRDEFLGFHLACNFDLREIGLVYYVIASSEQLADALRNCERYSRINNEGVRLSLSLDRAVSITLDYVNVHRWQDRHHLEFWMVTLVRICRQVTGNGLAPRQLKVRHLRTDPPAEFTRFFGVDVEFGADTDEIAFLASAASLPIVGQDTYLNNLLRRYAEEALALRPRQPESSRADYSAASSSRQSYGARGRTPTWDKFSNAFTETWRRGRYLRGNSERAEARSCQTISRRPRAPNFRNCVATRLSRGQLPDSCLQAMDWNDPKGIPFIRGPSRPANAGALMPGGGDNRPKGGPMTGAH
jgi:hypothetical protein